MTRGELTTFVLERLGVSSSRSAFVTEIQGHLNRSYVREVINLGLNMAETTLVFTADDPNVYLPDDWRRTETVRVAGTILIEKTPSAHQMLAADEANGAFVAPSYVVLYPPRRYRLVPTPTESETEGTLLYHAAPALMEDDGDEPEMLEPEFHDLIGEMTVFRMAANQEDPAMGQDAAAAAATIRQQLIEQQALAGGNSSGRVRRVRYG